LITTLAIAATPAAAVNADQGRARLRRPGCVHATGHERLCERAHPGRQQIIAGGTFTTVRQTTASANIVRNHIFAFDATTGAIDMAFNPNLNKLVNSLDTDGTSVYAGGDFTTSNGVAASAWRSSALPVPCCPAAGRRRARR
jgi:hypothetical protein